MKRTFISVSIIVLAVVAMLSVGVNAAFTQTENYTQGQFKDVSEKNWFAKDVESAYKLGFMNGTADDMFSPGGSVTVAQGITMAARANAAYNGKAIPEVSGEWYQMYVDYAMENGIIVEGQFDSLTRNIKRIEMAKLLYDAMPDGYYTAINDVKEVPDVREGQPLAEEIKTLYNAGIIFGSDKYGFFMPESDIKRSESAAIINRVALPENRVKGTLVDVDRGAYILADELNVDCIMSDISTSKGPTAERIQAGWVHDNAGGPIKLTNNVSYVNLTDISDTLGTALIRDLSYTDTGKVVVETLIKTGVNGTYIELRDENGWLTYKIKTIDNAWAILLPDGSYKKIMENAFVDDKAETFTFRLILDLDALKATTIINDVSYGESDLVSDNILNFRFATDEKCTGTVTTGFLRIYVNYLQFETFERFGIEELYGWKTTGKVLLPKTEVTSNQYDYELALYDNSIVEHKFTESKGRIASNVLLLNGGGKGFDYILSGKGKDVVKISVVDGKLMAGGKELYTLSTKFWYRFRLDVNTVTNQADILLNGRSIGKINIPASSVIDSLRIENKGGINKFDDFEMFEIVEYDDYVPVPEARANYDDYTVGINVCSIWKVGKHKGWACITPFEEREPVLGYYDEGSPESADWEIKYFVEHGIDFQAFCWYPTGKGVIPLKNNTESHSQLHDGYMYSKYSDYMDYCIIWEASNYGGSNIFDAEYFREYVVPFWFEHYFLDERYLKIDNKIILCAFAGDNISNSSYFGSPEAAKVEMDYLDEVAKSYGFDGVVLLSGGTPKNLAPSGIEAYYAYGWGSEGNSYKVNVRENLERVETIGTSYVVPTVSPGFDSIPWHYERYGRISVEEWDKLQQWVINEYLPTYKRTNDEWKWTENFVFTSTWNEYGEGSYLMPDHDTGFQYLDTLRKYYTNLPEKHTDVVPTETQRARINKGFPQYQTRVLPSGWHAYKYKTNLMEEYTQVVKTFNFKDANLNPTILRMSTIPSVEDANAVRYKVTEKDPQIQINNLNIDAAKANYLRLTINVPDEASITVYYKTSEDEDYKGSKQFKLTVKDGGIMQSIIIPTTHKNWIGTITGLRLDVDISKDVVGTEFEIKTFEVVDYHPERAPRLFIDDIEIQSEVPSMLKNGVIYSPFDQQTSIHYMLDGAYEYSHKTKVFKFTANHHVVEFTVGSNKYKVDGVEKDLGYTLELYDGVPMFDYVKFAKDLGYTAYVEANAVYVKTAQYDLTRQTVERTSGRWEFSQLDKEDWTSLSATLVPTNKGTLNFACSAAVKRNLNPNMSNKNVEIDADKYDTIEVRVKYKYDANANANANEMRLYFATATETKFEDVRSAAVSLKSTNSGENYEVYTFDFSNNPKWTGKITSLRFDPFNAYGEMEIDYIKVVK